MELNLFKLKMDKQTYYLNQSLIRASLNKRETHLERIERLERLGCEIWDRGAQMLLSIKEELKEKLNVLWEREDYEPAMQYTLKLPKQALGEGNTDFEPGYFSSFTRNIKNDIAIKEEE